MGFAGETNLMFRQRYTEGMPYLMQNNSGCQMEYKVGNATISNKSALRSSPATFLAGCGDSTWGMPNPNVQGTIRVYYAL